jgi:hypothetical protein
MLVKICARGVPGSSSGHQLIARRRRQRGFTRGISLATPQKDREAKRRVNQVAKGVCGSTIRTNLVGQFASRPARAVHRYTWAIT